MFRILRVRLYPTRTQHHHLRTQLESCRNLYNAAVEQQHAANKQGTRVPRYQQQAELPQIRRALPEFKTISSIILQDVLARVHTAFDRHHKRITGPPRYKKPGRYLSMSYSAHKNGNYVLASNHMRFGKFGTIKARAHLPPWTTTARPKGCTIKRTGDRWHAHIRFERTAPAPLSAPGDVLGLDLGIEHFAAASDGTLFPNLRSYEKRERRITRLRKIYDRRHLGGKNREKAHEKVARLFEKSREERLNHHHQITARLARQARYVAVEANITGLRRGMLRKHIYDAGWGQFLRILEYKLQERGGALLRVPRGETSIRCSGCQMLVPKPLSVRLHECARCGLRLQRDINAARNIQQRGQLQLPQEMGKVTPVEIGSYSAIVGAVPVKEAGTVQR